MVPPVTNSNFKVNLWEGTQLLVDGQSFTNSILQTNVLTIIPAFYYGAPIKDPVDAHIEQPGAIYYIDLNENQTYGVIGAENPDPILSLKDMHGNPLSLDGNITYATNTWLEVYEANGSSSRFWDNDGDGVWWASGAKNLSITYATGQWVIHFPGGIERIFDSAGRMIRHQDGWGRGITFTYANDLLTHAEHDNGQALAFAYSGTHVSSISAGSGLSMAYAYSNGLLETATRTVGTEQHVRSFQYTDGILTQRTNPAGHEYVYGYEADGNGVLTHKGKTLSVDAEKWFEHSVTYRSDTLSDVVYKARGLDLLHRYAFSSKTSMLTDDFGPGIGNADTETRGIHYGYNSAGDQTEETQFDHEIGESFSFYTRYDARHNPTNVAVAYSTTNQNTLSVMGWNYSYMLPAFIENAEAERTEMTYQNGSLKMSKRFYTASNSYDTVYGYTGGLLTSVQNANSHTTQYTYDSRGYPDTSVPALGPVLDTDYDAYGNLQTLEVLPEGSSTGTGRITGFNYNALGWLDFVVYADGLGVTNLYNGLGYLTNTVDRAGRATDYTYAPTKKLTSVTQYLEQGGTNVPVRISYDYDQWFNTVTITEPRGRYVESYQLDVQDRVTSVTNIEGQAMSIDYGVSDFVRKVTRFDGSSITNSYDNAGRQETMLYQSASDQLLETVSYDYYTDGQVKSIADNTTSVTNAYDNLNRLVSVTSSVPSVSSVVSYQYDPVGNVTNSAVSVGDLVSQQQGVVSSSYTYDAAERLEEISTSDAGVFKYVYNPTNGRISSISNTVSGITTSYTYDLLDRATNITYSASNGSDIRSLNYAYDVAGMITNKTIVDDASSFVNHDYQYDSIYRLVGESRTAGVSPAQSIGYAYDLAGNRTSVIDNGTTNTYTLGTGNRLASWGVNGSALYDVAGNTTNLVSNDGADLDLEWDERYRLVSVDGASSFVEYEYDVLGRKVSRTAGSDIEYYIYDGNQIVADVGASGNLLRSYNYGSGIDNILSMTVYGASTNSYYYLKDHQNTVIALMDDSGSVVESYDYDAYGQVVDVKDGSGYSIADQKSAIGNRYTFQGREIDWEMGLMYFRARWYNPEIGRWLSKDPIGISGGLNLYAFCGNNPVMHVDPLGKEWTAGNKLRLGLGVGGLVVGGPVGWTIGIGLLVDFIVNTHDVDPITFPMEPPNWQTPPIPPPIPPPTDDC